MAVKAAAVAVSSLAKTARTASLVAAESGVVLGVGDGVAVKAAAVAVSSLAKTARTASLVAAESGVAVALAS